MTAVESVGRRLAAPDTAHLARLATAGDAAAFDMLMEKYSGRVFRLALRMIGNWEEAEDVQQDTFLQAYRKLHTFRGEASFGTWVYAITTRLCLDRNRRAARRPVEVGPPPETLCQADRGPQERLAASEEAARVQGVLNRLSAKDRLLLVLKHVEELSHEEIAEVLGCSVESSRSRLARAKRLFREQYREEE